MKSVLSDLIGQGEAIQFNQVQELYNKRLQGIFGKESRLYQNYELITPPDGGVGNDYTGEHNIPVQEFTLQHSSSKKEGATTQSNIAFQYSRFGDPFSGLDSFMGGEAKYLRAAQIEAHRWAEELTSQPSENLKALLSHILYIELLHGFSLNGRDFEKKQFKSLVRTAPADAVVSVLSQEDVQLLAASKDMLMDGFRDSLATVVEGLNLDLDKYNSVYQKIGHHRVRHALKTAVQERLDAGERFSLPIGLRLDTVALPVSGKKVLLAGPSQSRRPIYQNQGEYFTVLEVRDGQHSIHDLASKPFSTIPLAGELQYFQDQLSLGFSAAANKAYFKNVRRLYEKVGDPSDREILNQQLQQDISGLDGDEYSRLLETFLAQVETAGSDSTVSEVVNQAIASSFLSEELQLLTNEWRHTGQLFETPELLQLMDMSAGPGSYPVLVETGGGWTIELVPGTSSIQTADGQEAPPTGGRLAPLQQMLEDVYPFNPEAEDESELVSEPEDDVSDTESVVSELEETESIVPELETNQESRYHNQIIIQLGDSNEELTAAEYLFQKHSSHENFSTWLELQEDGSLGVVQGPQAPAINENSRIVIVGHGQKDSNGEFSLAEHSPEQLADLIANEAVGLATEAERISLVCCEPGEHMPAQGVGQFSKALLKNLTENEGFDVDSITARTALLRVDTQGRKWTGRVQENGEIVWSHKDQAQKLLTYRDENGEIVSKPIAIHEGSGELDAGDTPEGSSGSLGIEDTPNTRRRKLGVAGIDNTGSPANTRRRRPDNIGQALERPNPAQLIQKKVSLAVPVNPDEPEAGLITGEEAIKGSGLPQAVIDHWKKVARENDALIAVRPVNVDAADLIAHGLGGGTQIGTKGLDVHGKSSDFGPQAGLIPFDAALSKILGNDGKVQRGNKDNQQSVTKAGISAQVLTMDRAALERRLQAGRIVSLTEAENGVLLATSIRQVNGHDLTFEFRMTPDENGLYTLDYRSQGYATETGQQEYESFRPLKVIAQNGKLLTADADLFGLYKKVEDVAKPDLAQVAGTAQALLRQGSYPGSETESPVELGPRERWQNAVRQIQNGLDQRSRGTFNPETGRMTEYQRKIIQQLNQASEVQLVNHGTEQDNSRFPERDRNILFIDNQGRVFQTRDFDQVAPVLKHYEIEHGFLIYTNRAYNEEATAGHYKDESPELDGSGARIPFKRNFRESVINRALDQAVDLRRGSLTPVDSSREGVSPGILAGLQESVEEGEGQEELSPELFESTEAEAIQSLSGGSGSEESLKDVLASMGVAQDILDAAFAEGQGEVTEEERSLALEQVQQLGDDKVHRANKIVIRGLLRLFNKELSDKQLMQLQEHLEQDFSKYTQGQRQHLGRLLNNQALLHEVMVEGGYSKNAVKSIFHALRVASQNDPEPAVDLSDFEELRAELDAPLATDNSDLSGYSHRVIIQLGDSPAEQVAAETLFQQQQAEGLVSSWLKVDQSGEVILVEGADDQVDGKAHLYLVGEGAIDEAGFTLRKLNADDLADLVGDPELDISAGRVSLVATGYEAGLTNPALSELGTQILQSSTDIEAVTVQNHLKRVSDNGVEEVGVIGTDGHISWAPGEAKQLLTHRNLLGDISSKTTTIPLIQGSNSSQEAEPASRYRNQVILQLDDSPAEAAAAQHIFNKHSDIEGFSSWMQLEESEAGELQVVLAEGEQWPIIGEDTRIVIVGHGEKGSTGLTLSGLDTANLAALLAGDTDGSTPIGRISLVACDCDEQGHELGIQEFSTELMQELPGVQSITARTALVKVDPEGRKWTGQVQDDGTILWSQKDGSQKLLVYRNGAGEIVSEQVGLHENAAVSDVSATPEGSSGSLGPGQILPQVAQNGPLADYVPAQAFLTPLGEDPVSTKAADDLIARAVEQGVVSKIEFSIAADDIDALVEDGLLNEPHAVSTGDGVFESLDNVTINAEGIYVTVDYKFIADSDGYYDVKYRSKSYSSLTGEAKFSDWQVLELVAINEEPLSNNDDFTAIFHSVADASEGAAVVEASAIPDGSSG
ncbi:MAG: C80 family cysteine peptidase, partial [Endozoicomonas sp.]